jgi:hypothetical protein
MDGPFDLTVLALPDKVGFALAAHVVHFEPA